MLLDQIESVSGYIEMTVHYRKQARCRRPDATPTAKGRGRRRSLQAAQPAEVAVGTKMAVGVQQLCRRGLSAFITVGVAAVVPTTAVGTG